MCAPHVSQVSNGYILSFFSFLIIIILLRSENVCTFVSQVSNGYIIIVIFSFIIIIIFYWAFTSHCCLFAEPIWAYIMPLALKF